MDKIIIKNLEVFYRVGVPETERARPQRLLVTVEILLDLAAAAESDELTQTIDYFAVCERLLGFGKGRSWKLLEKLAADVGDMISGEFGARSVSVQVKKFVIPKARYVAVEVTRSKDQ